MHKILRQKAALRIFLWGHGGRKPTSSVCCLKRNGDCLAKTQRTQRSHPIARAGTRHGTCKRKLQVKAFPAFGQMQGCADFMRLWRNFMPRQFSSWTDFTRLGNEPQSYYGAIACFHGFPLCQRKDSTQENLPL